MGFGSRGDPPPPTQTFFPLPRQLRDRPCSALSLDAACLEGVDLADDIPKWDQVEKTAGPEKGPMGVSGLSNNAEVMFTEVWGSCFGIGGQCGWFAGKAKLAEGAEARGNSAKSASRWVDFDWCVWGAVCYVGCVCVCVRVGTGAVFRGGSNFGLASPSKAEC